MDYPFEIREPNYSPPPGEIHVTTDQIIAEIETLNLTDLANIRRAMDARAEKIKAEYAAQAEAYSGKRKRKARVNKHHETEEHGSEE